MPDDRFIHRRAGHGERSNILSDLEHRVWIQMMLSADDFGILRASAVTLQADNDNLANRPARMIERCISAVVKTGLFLTFDHQRRTYAYQPDWQTWQKVAYPRTTNNPKPTPEALAQCDEPTQKLFAAYPGGAGRKRKERSGDGSENVPETVSDGSPLMRAGGRAKRLTANGERLMANGSEGGLGETGPPMDVWFNDLCAKYPQERVTRGLLTQQAFVKELTDYASGEFVAWALMQANLELNRASHEWRVKGMIPKLEKYLRDGLWRNVLPADPPAAERMDKSTAITLQGAAEFLREGKRGA